MILIKGKRASKKFASIGMMKVRYWVTDVKWNDIYVEVDGEGSGYYAVLKSNANLR
jgi:hypothetical protein